MKQPNTYEVKFWNHVWGIPPFTRRKTKERVKYCLEDLPGNVVTERVSGVSSPKEAVHKVRSMKEQRHKPFRLYKIRVIINEPNYFT